jgi:hypothetical protein
MLIPHDPHSEGALRDITARAAIDPAFRAKLIAEPRAAIRAEFGVDLPDDLRVRFIEKPSNVDILLVLPDLAQPKDELSDSELDAVAGGGLEQLEELW